MTAGSFSSAAGQSGLTVLRTMGNPRQSGATRGAAARPIAGPGADRRTREARQFQEPRNLEIEPAGLAIVRRLGVERETLASLRIANLDQRHDGACTGQRYNGKPRAARVSSADRFSSEGFQKSIVAPTDNTNTPSALHKHPRQSREKWAFPKRRFTSG